MSDRYGRIERVRQKRHDIRQPATEVLAPVEPVAAREAVGDHERLDCGRSKLGGGRVNLRLPLATPQIGGG
jgi:hypothetical protein